MAKSARPSKAPPGAPRNAGYTPNLDRTRYVLAGELSASELRAVMGRPVWSHA